MKLGIEIVSSRCLCFCSSRCWISAISRNYIHLITPRVLAGIIGFQLVILLIQTFQWGLILREAGIYRGVWWTFWARTSGFALTYLTPSMYFGGEPVRASLYKSPAMSYQKVYATIALDKYIELGGKIPCITVGFSLLVYFVHTGTILIFVVGHDPPGVHRVFHLPHREAVQQQDVHRHFLQAVLAR